MMLECSALNGGKVSDWLRLCRMTGGRSLFLSLWLLERYSFWVQLFHQLALLSLEIWGKQTHAVHKEGGHLAIAQHICWLLFQPFWLIVFKWQPFWYFSLLCFLVHVGSHRNFILGMNMVIYLWYMVITLLVILTYSFEMAAILVFSLICSHTHTDSHGNFICCLNTHICP